MKVQCSCGAKYEFEVTPEMGRSPLKFVCSRCGLDASDFVNQLVRQELGLPAAAPAPVVVPVAVPVQPAARLAPAARAVLHTAAAAAAPETAGETDAPKRCAKHPDQFVTDQCYVCSKPLCPKCMELFGYVCSPLCRGRAETMGIDVPVYANQRSVRERRTWRRTFAVVGSVSAVVVLLLGVWTWWAWFGSVPKKLWSVRFDEPSYSGESAFCGKDQIVFIHGDLLARYDMKQNKEIWSRHLVDKKKIDEMVQKEMKDMQKIIDRANSESPDYVPKMPDPEKLKKSMQRMAEEELNLRVTGDNIWVMSPGKITRYDRDTGNPVKEIPVPAGYGGLIPRGDELMNVDLETGKPIVTHINLNTCETRTEEITPAAPPPAAIADTNAPPQKPGGARTLAKKNGSGKAGLPVGSPGKDAGKVMDPKKVEEQAQRLTYAARIALPAILAHNMNQERTLAAYDDRPKKPNPDDEDAVDYSWNASLVPTQDGFMQFSYKLLEARFTTREAMKAAPAKSVLDGNLTVGKTADLANEMLNEAQRERGGATVREDESRYQATIRRLDSPEFWRGEVIGPPAFYPLDTVTVLASNKKIMVFDKTNRMLWQATLTYNVPHSYSSPDPEKPNYGQGPCVERQNSLYVYDEGVLTAFDLANGNVRWRMPSVGIMGLFFDDQGMLYANTTTASPDSLKYSNQIDITRKDSAVVKKLDPATGKILWSVDVGGLVSYVSGKFIYVTRSYGADYDEESGAYTMDSIMGKESYVSIKRLNPRNGRVMWEHVEKRAPFEVQFDQNTIRLVFRKEVEVLRFRTL